MRHTIGLCAAFVFLAACSSSSNGSNADAGTSDDGGTNPGNDGGTGEGGTTNPDGGGGGTFAWHAITLPDDLDANDNVGERVTGIACTATDKCVVSTFPTGEEGHIYATDGKTILNGGKPVVTGDDTFAAPYGGGPLQFLGLELVGSTLIARAADHEAAFITATGDITASASWTAGALGTSGTVDTNFAGNAQHGFGTNGTKWTMVSNNRVWEATVATPSAATTWQDIFSPQATPAIPADIATQRAADPTICDTDPSVSFQPQPAQDLYIAPDRSLIVIGSGSINQAGDDTPGVCISTDGGHVFHHSAFAGLTDNQGPTGVACSSKDHCVAFGGTQSNDGSAVIFVTNNASSGATSTWTKATIPTTPNDSGFRAAAFAPDGMHGWIVGSSASNGALMYSTTDGGTTWTDSTGDVKTLAKDNRLHSVYVYDATHVFIGGEQGVLLASGS